MQLSELEQTLSKEAERCTDLKVDILFLKILIVMLKSNEFYFRLN